MPQIAKCFSKLLLVRAISQNTVSQALLILKPESGPWTRTLKNLVHEKHEPWKTWTLKYMDPENHVMNMGLKMFDFRKVYFMKTMHNAIGCLNAYLFNNS